MKPQTTEDPLVRLERAVADIKQDLDWVERDILRLCIGFLILMVGCLLMLAALIKQALS